MDVYVVVDWNAEEVVAVKDRHEGAVLARYEYLQKHGWSDEDWSGSRVSIENSELEE